MNSFKSKFISLKNFGGLDRAVSVSILSRIISLFTGPVTAFMCLHFLTKEEQGFFYTFSSLQGLTLFFELGLTFLIMQFASYEKANLEWDLSCNCLIGDVNAKQRLSSLLRICSKYYFLSSSLLSVFLIVTGFIFFSSKPYQTQWATPWVLTCFTTAISLLLVPLNGILEGCGKIAEVYENGMYQIVASTVIFWIALSCGLGLYAPIVQWVASICVASILLIGKYRLFFTDLWKTPVSADNRISWLKEIWPLQWKLGIGWISCYFLYRFTTPLIFKSCGAIAAGQFGMSQKIFDTVQSTGFTWVNSKAAKFGTMRAQGKHSEAWTIFRKSLLFGSLLVFSMGALGVIGLSICHYIRLGSIAERFLGIRDISLMAINATLGCIISGIIVYIRTEKKDPFAVIYAIAAISQIILYVFAAPIYGIAGFISISILVNIFIFAPACIFQLKKSNCKPK